MGLFTNEFIDIIEWVDNTNDTVVWKFPRFQNEIKMGAKLTVRESQQAVFLNEGRIADVFNPGLYTLQTQNMPILTTIMGWKYGFNSPFKADVFYVSTKQFIDQKWGTRNAITLNDERFGLLELRAFGNFSFRVTDAGKFIKEIAGTQTTYTSQEIIEQLRTMVITRFTDAVGEGNIPVEKFASNLDELSQLCLTKINTDFESYGIQVTKFFVENISMPEDVKKEIFEYSRLNKIDMQKLAQFKAAKSIEEAAQNPGGAMGTGMGFGMGMGMGNMMTNLMANQMNPQNQQTPPPITQYFIAVNGQQTGPFGLPQLAQMAQNGQLNRNSMIWKTGMADWALASSVPDVNALFTNVPPPPPAV
jgi:membrane protease subunit (stomatin/prohibitin family)